MGCNLEKKNCIEIPFIQKQKYGSPIISVSIKNIEYNMIFDTGSSSEVTFYTTGIEKYFGSVDNYESQLSIEEKLYLSELADESYHIQEHIAMVKLGKLKFKDVYAVCIENDVDDYDGVIGYNLLKPFGTVSIDYNKNKIIINDGLIGTTPVSFEIHPLYKFLVIPIKINGEKSSGVIDTGFSTGEIPYLAIAQSKTGQKYCEINKNLYGDAFFYLIDEFSFANFRYENLLGIKFSELTPKNAGQILHAGSYMADIVADMNIVGNAFFVGHKIQFDFKTNEFRIQ